MFETLDSVPEDPLLRLITDFRVDPRRDKMDLGVGVYKTDEGRTPVMAAVKRAEGVLLATQDSKSYLGLAGDQDYLDVLAELNFAPNTWERSRLAGIQTPGGSAALRLAGDLIARSNPSASMLIGEPSWSNHRPVFEAAGLRLTSYRYYDAETHSIDYAALFSSIESAKSGDVLLLQGCCHNPTGVDLAVEDWVRIANACVSHGLLPLVDIAYNGLGRGFDEDMQGVDALLAIVPEALIAVSCSKNFGLYRERTGALYALAADSDRAQITRGNLFSLARTSYSMPPDHGAAIVRTILSDPALKALWLTELGEMRSRIASIRTALQSALSRSGIAMHGLDRDSGMFSLLPLSTAHIEQLRREDGIYMAGDGRINVASMNAANIEVFAAALERVWIS